MYTSEPEVLVGKTLADAGIDALFVRHAEATHNLDPTRLDGNIDYPLTEGRGIFEARQVGAYLATQALDLIVCADRARTKQTYDESSRNLSGIPFVVDARLNEQNYGDLAGGRKRRLRTKTMTQRAEDEGYDLQFAPNAETGRQVYQRAVAAILEAADTVPAPAQRNLRVAVISHSATIKNIVGIECGIPSTEMFGSSEYAILNGEIWLLKAGEKQPQRLFMPTHGNPTVMANFAKQRVRVA